MLPADSASLPRLGLKVYSAHQTVIISGVQASLEARMEQSHIFAGLDGRPRSEKPRTAGLTMVVDWGLGPNRQQDLQSTGAAYFDFAKIAVGLSRMYTNDTLRAKIQSYRALDIEPFPGGQYLEYADMNGKLNMYLPACAASGYRWIEVSDNVAPVELEWKVRVIKDATENYGMSVFGEVGKKEGLAHGPSFVEDAKACLDAGAKIILLEAAELVNADAETEKEVEDTVKAIGIDNVMFELPGPWIEGVTDSVIHRMRRELVDRFGVEVNIGNVMPDDLFSFEAYRRELGVNAGSPAEK
jgi:phosphosulfolactate synthase